MTNAKRFPADEAIHHTGQRGPMVVLASDHDAETDRLQRHLDSRNEQIDGYERQLGIDKAGAEHTIGSEIEQLRGNLSLAEEGLANYALEVERKNSLIDLQDEAQTSLHAENVRLREETERLLNIITGCPVCSELERNIQPSHEPLEQPRISERDYTDAAMHAGLPPPTPRDIQAMNAVIDALYKNREGASRDASSKPYPAFMYCPKCSELYTGRGGQDGFQMTLTCPNQHSWPDP